MFHHRQQKPYNLDCWSNEWCSWCYLLCHQLSLYQGCCLHNNQWNPHSGIDILQIKCEYYNLRTRNHSSTVDLPTVWASLPTRCQHLGAEWEGVASQWGPISEGSGLGEGALYSEDPCPGRGRGGSVGHWCYSIHDWQWLQGSPIIGQNDLLMDRHHWKHYPPTTSLAGSKNPYRNFGNFFIKTTISVIFGILIHQ